MAGGEQFELAGDIAGAKRAAGQHLDDALAGGIGQGGEMQWSWADISYLLN